MAYDNKEIMKPILTFLEQNGRQVAEFEARGAAIYAFDFER